MKRNRREKILKTNLLFFSEPYTLEKKTVEKFIDIAIKNKIKFQDESSLITN